MGDVKPFITPTCVFVKEFGIFFLNMITNSVLQSVYCRVNRKSMKYVLSNWIWYMSSVVYWSVAITTKRPHTPLPPLPSLSFYLSIFLIFSIYFFLSRSHIHVHTIDNRHGEIQCYFVVILLFKSMVQYLSL